MRKSTIGVIVIVVVVLGVISSSGSILNMGKDSTKVITYGETTYNNQEYKDFVEGYFSEVYNVPLENVTSEVISASDVNAISTGLSNKQYDSDQIFSCAYVDLNNTDNLSIHVDKTKITLVTAEMYASALNSSGIDQGFVVVTSPVSATGESALAGILSCYEKATNTNIPDDVKNAANEEIYAQSEVVNDSNVSADEIADLVSEVKEDVANNNTNDLQGVVSILEEVASEHNINLSQDNIDVLAKAIFETQSVKDQANNYKNQISEAIENGGSGFSIFNIFNFWFFFF